MMKVTLIESAFEKNLSLKQTSVTSDDITAILNYMRLGYSKLQ